MVVVWATGVDYSRHLYRGFCVGLDRLTTFARLGESRGRQRQEYDTSLSFGGKSLYESGNAYAPGEPLRIAGCMFRMMPSLTLVQMFVEPPLAYTPTPCASRPYAQPIPDVPRRLRNAFTTIIPYAAHPLAA